MTEEYGDDFDNYNDFDENEIKNNINSNNNQNNNEIQSKVEYNNHSTQNQNQTRNNNMNNNQQGENEEGRVENTDNKGNREEGEEEMGGMENVNDNENMKQILNNNENLNNEQPENFLETSIIGDVIKNLDNLELNIKDKSGDEAIEIRIKQLAYSKILVNIYEKEISYLIKAYTNLGVTYLENEYYEQAQEHLLTAFKLNEGVDSQTRELQEFQVKILINLSKCYLASNKAIPSINISEKALKMNETLFGVTHISNTDIYYVLAKGNAANKNYKASVDYFSKMFEMFEQEYGFDSEKCAKVCMELGQIYEMSSNLNDAIEYFKFAWEIWEKVLKSSPSDEGYIMIVDVAIKLSELIEQSGNPTNSYEILKACENKYGSTYEKKKKKSMEIKKLLIRFSEASQDLAANYEELLGLEVS